MKNNEVFDKKWWKFLRYRRIFSFIPFVDFVLAAGSLALGNVHEDSDFDVIVAARPGRIFTVRAFCVFVFGALGLRRKGTDHEGAARDKLCFSHFVTPKSYQLSPPYNDYWVKLYQNLVPVYGSKKAIEKFFEANDGWAPRSEDILSRLEKKYQKLPGGILKYTTPNFLRILLEFVLHEFVGDMLEKLLKKIQLERIEKSAKRDSGYKPRLRYDDEELEFHPDTRRIEEMLNKLDNNL